MTDSERPEGVEARPLPPLWRRIVDVFVSPGELFERLALEPKWIGAVLVGGLLVTLGAVLLPVELYENAMRAQFAARGQEVPGDPEQMARIGKIAGSVIGPVMYLLISLFVAGVCTLAFTFVLGDRGKFKQYLSATAHAFLIFAIASLAITPLKIAAGDPQLMLSLGNVLAGILPDGYFLNVLGLLDVFGIWSYAVLAIAATRIDSKRSFGSAFAILLAVAIGFAMIGAIFR